MLLWANSVCYADRTNISVAIIPMAQQYQWSETKQGLILSAFFYGYTVTQIPGGILAASRGAKIVLGVGVFVWSLFTFLTPIASVSLPILIVCRVLMGLGEGVNFPSIHDFCGSWIPEKERSFAVAFISSGNYVGTFLTLVLSPYISKYFGWEYIFYISGAAGFVWLGVFYFKVSSSPSLHPKIHIEEKAFIIASLGERENISFRTVPWKKLLKCMPFYAITVAHFCHNYGWFILISWLPKYYKHLGVELEQVGWFTVVPYFGMCIFSNVGGIVSTKLQSKGFKLVYIRKLCQSIAFLVPCVCFILLALIPNVTAALVLTTVALCGVSFSHVGFWVNMLDISPRYAGPIMSISNTIGSLAGVLGNVLTGVVLDVTGNSYSAVLFLMVGIYLLGEIFFVVFAKGEVLLA